MASRTVPRRLNGHEAPADSSVIARQRETAAATRRQRQSERQKAAQLLEQIRVGGDALDQKLGALRKQLGMGG